MSIRMGGWLLLAILVLTDVGSRAQVRTPTTLRPALRRPSARVGQEVALLVHARITPSWHQYATDVDPELGPTVFTFTFAKSAAYKLVGAPQSV